MRKGTLYVLFKNGSEMWYDLEEVQNYEILEDRVRVWDIGNSCVIIDVLKADVESYEYV
jgi:hypothetical protein